MDADGCADAGMIMNASYWLVHGQFKSIGARQSNTRDCIEVGPNVTDFTVSACGLASMAGGSATSRYGVSIAAGCDNYVIANNRANRNTTGGFLNTPGVAATRVFSGNLGSIAP